MKHDIVVGSAECLAYADFARSFRYGHHHDIHDTDTADEQRYSGDAGEHQCQHGAGAGHCFHNAGEIAHSEVVFFITRYTVALAHEIFDFRLHLVHFIGGYDLDAYGLNVVNRHYTHGGGRYRDDDDIILVLTDRGLAFALEQSDDFKRVVVDTDVFADRVDAFAEQVFSDSRTDNGYTRARINVFLRDEGTVGDGERADIHIIRRNTGNLRIPVLVAVYNLIVSLYGWRNVFRICNFFLDGFGIFQFQTDVRACRLSYTGCIARCAGVDDEHVAAETGDGVFDLFLYAHTD